MCVKKYICCLTFYCMRFYIRAEWKVLRVIVTPESTVAAFIRQVGGNMTETEK